MGGTESELADRLNIVLNRLDKSGLHLKKDKCRFGVTSINFLGFKIDSLGIRPSSDKVKSIQNAPAPTDKKQLQAFLGLLNFYHAFLPHKATIAEPLHRLLDKGSLWTWKREHQVAFCKLKELITSDNVLVHYNEKLPLILVCDASPYGIGAVLSHKLTDGSERPIAFYSRTLSKTERNYSQIDREATAIVTGVKKFHDYLHGKKFTLVTDHRPLLGIFCTAKPTPPILSTVMLRRCIFLNAYDFDLIYREGKKIGNADCLSRLPDETEQHLEVKEEEVLMIELGSTEIVNAKDVAFQTAKDPLLAKVLSWALRGWPSSIARDDQAYPYFTRRNEITFLRGCLLWGNRTIIPPQSRQAILHALHAGHPGIVKMKGLAKSYVWWPKLDSEIESTVKHCVQCQETRHEKPQAAIRAWETTQTAWSRLHIDFAGPFKGKLFFLVVDSYSKWLEVQIVKSTSSPCAINSLRSLFATHGLPDVVVSDNGTAFTSAEFQNFMNNNSIRHVRCAPFHPSSNGQVERMVQTTKNYLKKMPTNSHIELDLVRFVFSQHISPNATTGRSPAELLFNRQLKSYFDKIHPHELSNNGEHLPVEESFKEKDPVWIRNYASGQKWIPANIESQTGPLSYTERLQDNRLIKRHLDQIRNCASTINSALELEKNQISTSDETFVDTADNENGIDIENSFPSLPIQTPSPKAPTSYSPTPPPSPIFRHQPTTDAECLPAQSTPRRSKRIRKAPQVYTPSGR